MTTYARRECPELTARRYEQPLEERFAQQSGESPLVAFVIFVLCCAAFVAGLLVGALVF